MATIIWEGWSNMGSFGVYLLNIFIFVFVYLISISLVQHILYKFELSWDNEKFISYEFHLKEWERITREKKEEEEEERKREKERGRKRQVGQ